MIKNEYITQINNKLDQKVVSIITNEFSDIDLVRIYEENYDVYYLDKPLNWNKFIEWISAVQTHGKYFKTSKKSDLYIVNIDMLSRIQSVQKKSTAKKSKKSKSKKVMTVDEFINLFRFHIAESIILFSEKPYDKKSKFTIKPIIFGDVPDYTNKIWVVETLMYDTNNDKKLKILDNVNFETIKDLLLSQSLRHPEFIDRVIQFLKLYEGLKYETKRSSLNKFILSTFDGSIKKKSFRYPIYYKDLFTLKDKTSNLYDL